MPTPIRLQPRDLDMLESLGIARFLTVQALEWLHYPTWREAWTRHQEAQREGASKRAYYPLPNLYRRLEGLAGGRLVVNIKRTQERATVVFSKLADVYALTEAGAELLATERGIDPETLTVEGLRPRSLTNLEHSVSIANVYAALRSETEFVLTKKGNRLNLVGWKGDHILARDYDRLKRSVFRGEYLRKAELPVLPDATFELVLGEIRRRYFVELDRATRPLDSWREKAEAYNFYRQSDELQARYNVNDFVLLVVAPTASRLQRIAEQIVKIDKKPGLRYQFIEASNIHPMTIRASWQLVTEVTTTTRRIAGNSAIYAHATMGDAPLWT